MKYLYKIFHEKQINQFEDEKKIRLTFPSTIKTDIKIKPINQSEHYNLYYIPSNEIIDNISNIIKNDSELEKMFNSLPGIAQNNFFFESLVEELYNTNELEGVSSSREEVAESTKSFFQDSKTKKRFFSMINSYNELFNGELANPREVMDIRKIFDYISKDEIAENELPDGDIFRKDVAYVYKKNSVSHREIHRGVMPETSIIESLEKLLQFLNEEKSIPELIKIAIAHYYFGYIHPFYDGNGRTSRFISSIYLKKYLNSLTGLSLSRGCNNNKKIYLKAFEESNKSTNAGEMNLFIDSFFDIIIEGQTEILNELKEKTLLLGNAFKIIEKQIALTNDEALKTIMFIFVQNHFFAANSILTVKEIADYMNNSAATIRNKLFELKNLNFIKSYGKKPVLYKINEEFLEKDNDIV